jgi:uncharacterized DUF497 family protein
MIDLFEWNPKKAETNFKKYGVSFEEASVYFDPLSITVSDPLHSDEENRFVITGLSDRQRHLVIVHRTEVIKSESSAHDWQRRMKEESMNKKQNKEVEMLDEYDFTGGVRGKYVDRLANRKNVITLEPDVAAVFTDSESVNQALRGLLPIIQRQAEKVHQQ